MKLDLHMHSNCSDGSDDWKTILQKAEEAGLECISITDHNNCDVYFQLEDPKKYFSGKIITGIEPECFYKGHCIEILGYGFDVRKMRDLLDGLYKTHEEISTRQLYAFHETLAKGGVRFSPDVLTTWDREKHYYAGCHLHADLIKYPQNKKILTSEEAWNNSIQFYRIYAANIKSPFYIDESNDKPPASTMYNLIKQAGGLVFIPHAFLYGEDSIELLESLMKDFEIDGIECFYTVHTPEQTQFLLDFCKKHNLLVSAGSDYHGPQRPLMKLGMQDARFKDLMPWIDKVQSFG